MEFPAFRVVKRHGENRGVYSLWECICKSFGAPLQVFTGENWDAQKAIATTRQTLGLTQEEFARRISINDSGVSRWETGETLPSRRVREKLYAAFGSEIFTEFSKLEGD
jgi:DNA-binding XRE family transcriptional regulator